MKLQREAREQRRGLWADPSVPTTPPPVARADRESAGGRLGVGPENAWTCPPSHPIKGNYTTYSGEPCIHHMPGGSSTAGRSDACGSEN